MTKMGKNLTLKVTAPLAAFGALSLKTAADFSRAMAKVNAVTGATTEQFEELNAVAKELGRTTQFTATQVAEAMSFMGMAGMDTNQILAAIPDTLNLAAAGALDMGTAANIVTNILAGFGMRTDQLGGAVDVLAKAFTSSNTDLLMLGESMKFAGPVAKGFGMTFEETAAIMGIFGNAGIQASLAGTSLRAAIVQLDKKAEQFGLTIFDAAGKMIPMADILEQLEQKGFTASEMMELFGLRAGPAMTALLESGSEALRDFTTELENSGGTAQFVAETQMEGLHGSLIKLKSAFEGLQLAIADEIAPTFEGLIGKLTDLFRWFADLPGPIKGATVALFAFLAALGPVIWATGFFIKQLIALKLAFMAVTGSTIVTTAVLKIMIAMTVGLKTAFVILTGTVLALVAGIGMLVFGIVQLIKNSKMRREQAELEAKQEKVLAKLKEEHALMMEGLDNKYLHLLREAKEMGFVIGEEQEAYLKLNEAIKTTSYEQDRLTEAMKVAAKKWRIATDATKELTEQNRELLALYAKLSESKETDLGLVEEQLIRYKELGGVLTTEAEAWLVNRDAMRAANAELERHIALRNALMPAIMAVRRGVITPEVYFQLAAKVSRVREAAGLPGYQYGGPILGPTLLTSLRTMQPYAVAGEGPRQEWVGGGGGYKTANIYLMLDSRTVAQVIGEPLVDEIRLKTGARY